MLALRRIVRTTAFRLSVVYLVVFTLLTLFLVAYVSRTTGELLSAQLRDTIETEVDDLKYQHERGGIRRLITVVEQRSRTPGANLYLISDFSGNYVAGNVADLPPDVMEGGEEPAHPIRYTRFDSQADRPHFAIVRVFSLDGGFRVLVGRDIGEREQFREIFRSAFRAIIAVMVVLGAVTWLFVSRRVLRRIDEVSATSRKIVAGDLSGRLPVSGSGDEFDRLAINLNGMLERIDDLMGGLKEVSDNIAHDLKTPLTRMRNRVEGALAAEPDLPRYRAALEQTIEECDRLITTFNALLTIARVESGSQAAALERLNVVDLARGVVELYEPAAEEEGVSLILDAPAEAYAMGNRELLAQALSNLVDNALKYARAEGRDPAIRVGVEAVDDKVAISVTDNGPGIPEAQRDHVLGRFVRLEESRSMPGSGLGLSLVAAIAHLHGTSILLDDARPGLRATLRLAKAEPPPLDRPAPAY